MSLPHHSLFRADRGFAHAIALDTGEKRWHVIDLYGETHSWNGTEPYTETEMLSTAPYHLVHDPCRPTPPERLPEKLPPGTLKVCDVDLCAIKIVQPSNHGEWLIFSPTDNMDLVDDEHVRDWEVVYIPV